MAMFVQSNRLQGEVVVRGHLTEGEQAAFRIARMVYAVVETPGMTTAAPGKPRLCPATARKRLAPQFSWLWP
jgi:hypothetical protein